MVNLTAMDYAPRWGCRWAKVVSAFARSSVLCIVGIALLFLADGDPLAAGIGTLAVVIGGLWVQWGVVRFVRHVLGVLVGAYRMTWPGDNEDELA